MNTDLNPTNYAWLAGFWQGEGCIHTVTKGIALSCSQVEVYPLGMCRWILGAGSVTGPYKNRLKKHKLIYQFNISNFEEVQMTVILMWPWLSPRRKAQAKIALIRHVMGCRQRAERNRFCKRGHERTPVNWRVWNGRNTQCKLCYNMLSRERYHRRKNAA